MVIWPLLLNPNRIVARLRLNPVEPQLCLDRQPRPASYNHQPINSNQPNWLWHHSKFTYFPLIVGRDHHLQIFCSLSNHRSGAGPGWWSTMPLNSHTTVTRKQEILKNIPLAPMGVLAPGSAHVRPSTRPPIDTRRNFPAHISAELPSNISPNPS